VVIVNSSLFNPTPTLSSLVVSRFDMRPDVQEFNLAGASFTQLSLHASIPSVPTMLYIHRVMYLCSAPLDVQEKKAGAPPIPPSVSPSAVSSLR